MTTRQQMHILRSEDKLNIREARNASRIRHDSIAKDGRAEVLRMMNSDVMTAKQESSWT